MRAFSITLTNQSVAATGPRTGNVRISMLRGETHSFAADDFPFRPGNRGRGFHGVRIVSLPALGTLALRGSAVTANDLILVADLEAGRLTYTPVAGQDGQPYTSFDFKVSDGTLQSATATVRVDVYPVAEPAGFSVERLAPDGVRLSWSPPAAGGAGGHRLRGALPQRGRTFRTGRRLTAAPGRGATTSPTPMRWRTSAACPATPARSRCAR